MNSEELRPEKIKLEEIGIVIQGPLLDSTYDLVSGLRLAYPSNEIVVSTWSDVDFSELRVVSHQAEDPGPLIYKGESFFQNINRQIVSTREGITLISKPYVVKLRSDFELKSDCDLIDNVRRNLRRNRILIDTNRKCYPFFPWFFSDFVSAGSKELMEKLWSVPLATTSHAQYFMQNPGEVQKSKIKKLFTYPAILLPSQWSSEQYIYINFAKGLGLKVIMRHKDDFSVRNLVDSYRFAGNYLTAMKRSDLGVTSKKHFLGKQSMEMFYWNTLTHFKNITYLKITLTLYLISYILFHFLLFLKARALKTFRRS